MVKWDSIINNFPTETVKFVNGQLTLRDFARSVKTNSEAASAIKTVQSVYKTEKGRYLARRALNRRGVTV